MKQSDLDKILAYTAVLSKLNVTEFLNTLKTKAIEWKGKLNG